MITSLFKYCSLVLLVSMVYSFQGLVFEGDEIKNENSIVAYEVTCHFKNEKQQLIVNSTCVIDKVELFNLLGQSVISNAVCQKSIELDMTGLISGPYYGKVFLGQESHSFVFKK